MDDEVPQKCSRANSGSKQSRERAFNFSTISGIFWYIPKFFIYVYTHILKD